MHVLTSRWLVGAFLIVSASCARIRQVSVPSAADSAEALDPSSLEVENRNWQDVVIYAVHDGTRTRLGTVNAAATRTFELKGGIVLKGGDLRFAAHAIGETRTFVSERVLMQSGQRAYWTLESGLERSSLTVR